MTEDGQELSLNTLKTGAEFGESALLAGGMRNASVRCSSAVEALRLEREDFLKLLAECPEFKNYLELTARWRAVHGFLYQFSNFGRLPAPCTSSRKGGCAFTLAGTVRPAIAPFCAKAISSENYPSSPTPRAPLR